MSNTIKVSNPKVSDVLLKSLGNDAKGPPVISNTEWKAIEKVAINEVKRSENPTTTLRTIKNSFELADRVTSRKYHEKFSAFVENKLAPAADDRKAKLRQIDHNDWNRPSRPSRGGTT